MIVSLKEAATLLNTGHIVAVPTETVYGLAASIRHPDAIAEIFRLKNRPKDNPLIVHLSSTKELETYAVDIPASAYALANSFWPGPLTMILTANTDLIHSIIRAELPMAAFRVPHHPLALELLSLTGPLVMPSANLSGSPSATSAKHVAHDFKDKLPILDGGQCSQGVESTILFLNGTQWEIVRLGAIAPDLFLPILGYVPSIHSQDSSHTKPLCPGQMYRHYAPKADLKLIEEIPVDATGAVVGFSDKTYPSTCRVIKMGRSKYPEEVAANLYDVLRFLDTDGITSAMVDYDMPDTGLWLTIRERLQKAASKQ